MSAYFRSPQSAAYFSDPATYSNASPVFSVDSVSGGDQPGESWVFALINASGSGMTANIGGTALTVTAQTSGSITVTIPDLLTFDGGIHRFSENLTVQIVDGANSDTIATPITPATGFAQVQMPDPIAGVWASSTFEAAISPAVLAIGDYIHCTAPTDSDPANGVFPEDSSIVYHIMDMSDGTPAWGTSGTITIPAADDEAPVITLTGDATINLSEGDSYTEQGATWTDNVDGSGAATVGGDTVDTATPGTYTVTYNYTDAAGNAATQVTRTVTVNDITAPVITLLGPVTITHAHGTAYTDAGATASDNADGDITNSIAVTNLVNVNAVGSYFVHYDVTDAAGNAATRVTRTVNVTDQAAPIVTLLGSATVNLAIGQAFTDPGATATDAVDGNLTAFVVVSGSVNVNMVGTYTLTYSATDAAGNVGSATRSVVVAADVTAPVITLTGSAAVTHPQGTAYVDAGATATDNVDGNISANIVTTGASFDYNTTGTYYVRYNVTDAAGNAANEVVRTVIVTDQTAPVITLTGGNVTLEQGGTYSEPGYSATDNNDASVSVTVTGSVDVNTPGTYTITYDATDAAGNAAIQRVRTVTVSSAQQQGPFVDAGEILRVTRGQPVIHIHDGESIPTTDPIDTDGHVWKQFNLDNLAVGEALIGTPTVLINEATVNIGDSVEGMTFQEIQTDGSSRVKVRIQGGERGKLYVLTIRYSATYTPSNDRSQQFYALDL